MKSYALWVSASVLTLVWCNAAVAQPAAAPEDPCKTAETAADPAVKKAAAEACKDSKQVDKVVVTAERRRTSLQKAPISATVITGEELENKGVTDVNQLQFISPAASVNNFGQGIDFNIRGIGKAEHNTQTTTGVITYRDGVATFPGYFTAEPYYDIGRVEILRGPQGTFVGQNATGGAVFVTTNNPVIDGGYHGYIAAQVANYSGLGAQGAMNIPVNDELAMRVAFNVDTRDSFYDITGPYTGDDGLNMLSGRVSLLWQPTSQFTVLLKHDQHYLDFGGYPSDPVLRPNDIFEITSNAEHYAKDKFSRTSLRMDYAFADGTTIRSITGYQEGNSAYKTDLDGTSVGINIFRDSVDEVIWSQEVNVISSDDARIRWILGAFFQTDEHQFNDFYIGTPPGVFEYTLGGINPKQSEAVFGQIGFNLLESLELQLGARYSDTTTKNEGWINQYGALLVMQESAESEATTGKVSLNWTVDDHNFVYGFVATGFKPGGLNVNVGPGIAHPPFDAETVTSYELGWKAGFLDGNVRTQLSTFYNEYDDFQVIIAYPTFPTFGMEFNVPGTTRNYGVELQAEAVFGAFSADMGLGWMHSELGEFYAVDPRPPIPFVLCDPKTGPYNPAGCRALEGQDQTYAPEITFNIGAQYVFDLGDGYAVTPRLNYGHVSQQWATLFENAARGDRIEERDIFNAQLAFTTGEWTATLYGTNITDQHYVAAINTGMRFAGPPRQFGLRIMKVF